MAEDNGQGIPLRRYDAKHTDVAIPNSDIVATALYVPAGISPDLLAACAADIREYNDDRGIDTQWSLPSND